MVLVFVQSTDVFYTLWHDGAISSTLCWQSTACRYNHWPFCCRAVTSGKSFTLTVPHQAVCIKIGTGQGRWWAEARKVTECEGLAKNNGHLPLGLWVTNVKCMAPSKPDQHWRLQSLGLTMGVPAITMCSPWMLDALSDTQPTVSGQ